MKEANTFDFLLLVLLAFIWGSSFFNIKIATYTYEPITLALVRVIFASIPLLILCKVKKIYIEAFSKNWSTYALIGLCNIAIPFVLIAIGTAKINSYLAAILMSTTPLSGSILAHFFTKDEKLSYLKSLGVLPTRALACPIDIFPLFNSSKKTLSKSNNLNKFVICDLLLPTIFDNSSCV